MAPPAELRLCHISARAVVTKASSRGVDQRVRGERREAGPAAQLARLSSPLHVDGSSRFPFAQAGFQRP